MNIALLQTAVSADKKADLARARERVLTAAEHGARLAVLPEMFFCPYSNECFPKYAEERGGAAYRFMADTAKEAGVTLVAGSMPERDKAKLYNTAFVFDSSGAEIARHRKAHLFDIAVEGGQRFCESEVFTPGDDVTLFNCEGHAFGLCICFDIRFAELFRVMALKGAQAVIVPAAFNMTTGPMHWELTFRMRAVDNQLFTLGAACARDESASYVSYANSIVCSPWGKVLARAGEKDEILYAEIDFCENKKARSQIPILSARRPELYV